MEIIKSITASLFLIASAGWILVHLILMAVYGTVEMYEPNKLILYGEIIFTSLIIVLGIERFIKAIK